MIRAQAERILSGASTCEAAAERAWQHARRIDAEQTPFAARWRSEARVRREAAALDARLRELDATAARRQLPLLGAPLAVKANLAIAAEQVRALRLRGVAARRSPLSPLHAHACLRDTDCTSPRVCALSPARAAALGRLARCGARLWLWLFVCCAAASRVRWVVLDAYVAPHDAAAVARLRSAGALLLAHTSMDEFGMGSHSRTNASVPHAAPANVRGAHLSPGGSSGGSGCEHTLALLARARSFASLLVASTNIIISSVFYACPFLSFLLACIVLLSLLMPCLALLARTLAVQCDNRPPCSAAFVA